MRTQCGKPCSGCCGTGEKVSLFLEDWELAKVAFSCHIALDMLCEEMQEALCHSKKSPFSHRGRAVTKKETDV